MTTVATVAFWIALALLVYIFIVYPGLIALLSRLRPRPLNKKIPYRPRVSLVMAARNEEERIAGRLQNYIELDYPRELLTFLIGSDDSDDRTDEVVENFVRKDPSVIFRRFERSGKTKIIYELARSADAEIIIFTDADVIMRADGLQRIVDCFSDSTVGGVVTTLQHMDLGSGAGAVGQRKFTALEDRLRVNESLYWTTVGPSGPCFAVRKGAYSDVGDGRLSDDVTLVITIAENGYRVWFEPSVILYEINRRTLRSEMRRRLRIGQHSTSTILAYSHTRYPWRSFAAFELWSHKLLRNLAAFPAVLLLCSSLLLMQISPVYKVAAGLNIVWTAMVALGLIIELAGTRARSTKISSRMAVLRYPLFFTAMLASLAVGSIRGIRSGGFELWNSPRVA